jgi:hypothetical protein
MATALRDRLGELHAKVCESYYTQIDQNLTENIPTDAAFLSGAVKFLKDNEVTADPASKEDISALRGALTDLSAQRRARAKALVDKAKESGMLAAVG